MPTESSAMRFTAPSVDGQSHPATRVTPRSEGQSAPWMAKYGKSLVVVDLVAIVTAVAFAQWVRFGDVPGKPALTMFPSITYLAISFLIAIVWMATLSVNNRAEGLPRRWRTAAP